MESVDECEIVYLEEIYEHHRDVTDADPPASAQSASSPHIETLVVQTSQLKARPNDSVDSNEESDEECRIPAAWKLRETLAQELHSPHEKIRAQTLNFKSRQIAQPLKAERPQLSQSFAYPTSVSGYQTLPINHAIRHNYRVRHTPSILMGSRLPVGSFYRFPFRSDLTPPRILDDDVRSIGSQFTPAHPPQMHQNVIMEPSPNLMFPASADIPPPPHSIRSVSIPAFARSEFIPSESGSSSLPELKPSCSTVCCSSGFIVLWLIMSVVLIGIIVGITVVFSRRNLSKIAIEY